MTYLTSMTILFEAYFILSVTFDILAFTDDVSFENIGKIIAFVMPVVVAGLVDIQFCTFVLLVRRRLIVLNEKLESVLQTRQLTHWKLPCSLSPL